MKTFILLFLSLINISYASSIIATDAKIRMIPPISKTTAMYLNIKNTTKDDISLVKITSDLSSEIEFHEMKMDNGKMEMRAMDTLLLKGMTTTELKSGGLHIMIFNIKKSLKLDEKHTFHLEFSNKEKLDIEAIVSNL